MKKIVIGVIAMAVLATAAIFVIGQKAGGRGNGMGPGGGMPGMMLRGLDLTDAQKAQVKEITDASKARIDPIREAMKANHQKLDELTANGAFDEAQVSGVANEIGNTHARMIVERERVRSQIFAILTDEQKAKAAEMRTGMKERFQNRGGRRGGDKGPGGTDF